MKCVSSAFLPSLVAGLVLFGCVAFVSCRLNKRNMAGGTVEEMESGGRTRRFILHVPSSVTSEKKVPLVIVLHGGGGNGENAAKMSGFTAKSDREGFIVVYPYGTGRFDERLLTWNSGNCCGYALDHNIDDAAFIRNLIELIKSRYSIDGDRIFATGISNGGMMSYRLACELSDVIRGIAPVAGALNVNPCSPQRPVITAIIHGRADRHVLYDGGPPNTQVDSHPRVDRSVRFASEFWQKVNGCTAAGTDKSGRIETRHFTCQNAGLVVFSIDGEGHTWPGGEKGYILADPPARDFSATDAMWDFWMKSTAR